jgi:hypothetical protein
MLLIVLYYGFMGAVKKAAIIKFTSSRKVKNHPPFKQQSFEKPL